MASEDVVTTAALGRRLGFALGAVAGFLAVALSVLPIPYGGGYVLLPLGGLLGALGGGLVGAVVLGLLGGIFERMQRR